MASSLSQDGGPPRPPRKILLINGSNLNLLGTREPGIYGSTTLAQVLDNVTSRAQALGVTVVPFQSNHEGAIIDFLHSHFIPTVASAAAAAGSGDGLTTRAGQEQKERTAVIINPAAFTHTSVAIRDALLATSFPFVELHISNVHAREPWRSHSYFSDKAVGIIMGLGAYGYIAALEFWAQKWDAEDAAAAAAAAAAA